MARLAVLIPMLFFLSRQFGLLGILYAEFLGAAASLFVSYPVLFRHLRISLLGYLGALWRPLVASAVMGATVFALISDFNHDQTMAEAVRDVAIGVPSGVLTYAFALWALWRLSRRSDAIELAVARLFASTCRSFARRLLPATRI